MKIYISADMEGTAGIVDWSETDMGKFGYEHFAKQMTREVAAACEGAIAGGAEAVTVKDGHDSGRNINPEALPEQVKIIRSWARQLYTMMAGLDNSFDGVMFTGYHSAASMPNSPLSHTMNTRNLWTRINGVICPELYINALTAAYEGLPVMLVTGDQGICDWIHDINPNIPTVAVSRGIGGASESIQPNLAVKLIREAAEHAMALPPESLMFPLPEHFKVEICFKSHIDAANGANYPGCVRVDSTTVSFEADDYKDVLRFIYWVL